MSLLDESTNDYIVQELRTGIKFECSYYQNRCDLVDLKEIDVKLTKYTSALNVNLF